jgi:hypothetical protein
MPIDGVVLVLKQVGTRFLRQAVGHGEILVVRPAIRLMVQVACRSNPELQ